MAEPDLSIRDLCKSFGGLRVTDHVSIDIMPGELHAVIGPNGAGKTTLINQISGILPSDAGELVFKGQNITRLPIHERADIGIARSFQVNSVLPGFSALENVALAVQARLGTSFRFVGSAAAEPNLNALALAKLDEVGLAYRSHVLAAHLSHGEKRVLELAMAMAMQPKLLLLDEPMAGTSHEESVQIIALLERLKGQFPIVLVEHDMNAVFALADHISVLLYGRLLASGTPDQIRSHPQVIAAYLGDDEVE